MSEQNQQIKLTKRPEGTPTNEHFEIVDIPINSPNDGEVLIKTIYLSVDPYMRGRMSAGKSYVKPFEVDKPMNGTIVGEVVTSESESFSKGDLVRGMLPWQRYNVVSASYVEKIDPSVAPLTAYLSVLGLTGLTAYFGLLDIGQPKEGETVVVSAAAGAVGSSVGQIAKIKGAHVVGIAGTDEKIDYLENQLGFDKAVNYKDADFKQQLKEACPNGVDVYFDNVGGEVTDNVISLLNDFARIPLCGAISTYNLKPGEDHGPSILPKILKTRTTMKGFIVSDYQEQFPEAIKDLAKWVAEDKLSYEVTTVDGFENTPTAFLDLFEGKNKGKQLVKVSEISS
ncbi:NADP-dependent oxidoreductase [Oceanobacillus iheyensis]|uniref:NADP-dependent oxidoreductase n=1 Tax=Oceanobacillus iheyensis TaxID=182710 RepID=UPI00362A64EE